MTVEIDYNTMYTVIDLWERLRRIPDYETVAGKNLFQRLFIKCPPTKVLFGFPKNMDPMNETLLKSRRFLLHSRYMIQMLDRALNMLGPDIDLLGEILTDLGKKHAKYGVKDEYFPLMGQAMHEVLKDVLGPKDYSPEEAVAWNEVYTVLSKEMCKTMNKEKAVLESWEKLKAVDNYEVVAGEILFQSLFLKCPDSKVLFGFPMDMDPTSDSMLTSKRFRMHSSYFIEMLDNALHMMEKEKLDENMQNLGEIHSMYGVKEEFFPLMGQALNETLAKILKDDFTPQIRKCWEEVYVELAGRIITAMKDA